MGAKDSLVIVENPQSLEVVASTTVLLGKTDVLKNLADSQSQVFSGYYMNKAHVVIVHPVGCVQCMLAHAGKDVAILQLKEDICYQNVLNVIHVQA